MKKERLSALAPAQRRAIEIARSVAREKALRPYLVGGPVRDLLLGRLAIDIDLTLEEGSSTFARTDSLSSTSPPPGRSATGNRAPFRR
jgi:tRNA nucleotidyltransferase/poly(A) polymerase